MLDAFHERRRRFIKNTGSKALWSFERMIARNSRVGGAPVLARHDFPWIERVERFAPVVRRELDALLEHRTALPNLQDISRDQTSITSDDRWKAYFFFAFGERSEANCMRCPLTASLLGSIPGLSTAFFSILAPGKHVPKHRGVYKGLVRVHLGVKVPEPERCRMEIAGHTLRWEEGRAFVFDDTFDHEVWNDGEEERVVLLIDVLRPLPPSVDVLNRALIAAVRASPFVTDAVANERAWERRFAEAIAHAGAALGGG